MSAVIKIIQPAILTQLQDLGRFGHMHRGISVSGAMDEPAFLANNRLLGNDPNAAQLEIAPGGLILEFLADTTAAIAGAYANPTLDGKPLINYHSFHAKAQQQLRLSYPKTGQYSYLAIAGGFAAPKILGSRATCQRLGLIPLAIQRNTILTRHDNPPHPAPRPQGLRWHEYPERETQTIAVQPAYQYAEFSPEAKHLFTQQTWRVQQTDRMGTLLTGAEGVSWQGGELLSEGIIPGAIQISNNGMPIVLQKDAQTIGGYPKIGLLDSEARSQLAQMRSGESLRFTFQQG